MNICVFCASSSRLAPEFVECARSLGTWIGKRGHTLVWGGCNVGLMETVGRAACDAGARTVAVIPEFLIARGLAFEPCTERVVTQDLAERKAGFRRRADAFVALPGGVGTWEEVLEVIALRKLAQLAAPIVIANVKNYYDPLLELVRQSIVEGFSSPDFAALFAVATDAAGIAACLESPSAANAPHDPGRAASRGEQQ